MGVRRGSGECMQNQVLEYIIRTLLLDSSLPHPLLHAHFVTISNVVTYNASTVSKKTLSQPVAAVDLLIPKTRICQPRSDTQNCLGLLDFSGNLCRDVIAVRHSAGTSVRRATTIHTIKQHSLQYEWNQINFMDPETVVYTQTIEILWGSAKWRNKNHGASVIQHLNSYLAEFMSRSIAGNDKFNGNT